MIKKNNMKLISKIKVNFVWIVFVVISFSSTIYLTGEFLNAENYSNLTIKNPTNITNENESNSENQSNDHQIIETIGAILIKFIKS